MTRAIYPGTFDPVTSGHEDLVRRAAKLFGTVVVCVADSVGKSPIFTPAERIEIAREVFADNPAIEVVGFSGLMVDLYRAQKADVVVRGLRAVSDFDYEFQLAGMNRQLLPGTETVFMTPGDDYQYISGTLVREIARMGGDVSRFVPAAVMPWLQRKLNRSTLTA